jgi:hypothetical protein
MTKIKILNAKGGDQRKFKVRKSSVHKLINKNDVQNLMSIKILQEKWLL